MSEEINTELEKTADAQPSQLTSDHESQHEVEEALVGFKAIRGICLQRVFNALPLIILLGSTVFILLLRHIQGAWGSVFITASTTLASIISVLITQNLCARFPETLLIIWRRKLLRPRAVEKPAPKRVATVEVNDQFQRYISLSEDRLNSKMSMAFGFVVLLIAFWLGGQFQILSASEWVVNLQTDPLMTVAGLLIFLGYYVFAFVAGLLIWRIATIAWLIRQLGVEFDFNLQIKHPDGCGGLRGIGDLCLMLAYVLSPFLLLVGGWLIVINLTGQTYWNISASTAQTLLIPMVVLSLICFFQPLITIHTSMIRSKLRLQKNLDLISLQIHQLSEELLANAGELSPEDGARMEKKIDFLRHIYDQNNAIPTWPVRYDHLWRLATTQVTAVIGLVTSGIEFFKNLQDTFQQILE